jgi:hypothetical protein
MGLALDVVNDTSLDNAANNLCIQEAGYAPSVPPRYQRPEPCCHERLMKLLVSLCSRRFAPDLRRRQSRFCEAAGTSSIQLGPDALTCSSTLN